MAESDPAFHGERAGQVGDGGLGRDDQVKEAHHGGCIEEVAARFGSSETIVELGDAETPVQRLNCRFRGFLQADQAHARNGGQRCEELEGE